ncbi:MAG: hypothetical protein MZV70_70265, partial [Desulfobacterales bacterium]|nr:hypothetical protein [Desulfobacterales bacterium]
MEQDPDPGPRAPWGSVRDPGLHQRHLARRGPPPFPEPFAVGHLLPLRIELVRTRETDQPSRPWSSGPADHETDDDPRAGRRVPALGFQRRVHEPDEEHPRHRLRGPRPRRPAAESGQGLRGGRPCEHSRRRRQDRPAPQGQALQAEEPDVTITLQGTEQGLRGASEAKAFTYDLSLGGTMIQSEEAYPWGPASSSASCSRGPWPAPASTGEVKWVRRHSSENTYGDGRRVRPRPAAGLHGPDEGGRPRSGSRGTPRARTRRLP